MIKITPILIICEDCNSLVETNTTHIIEGFLKMTYSVRPKNVGELTNK